MSASPAEEALIARLKAVPKGKLTGVADRAGLDVTYLLRLRRGVSTNIQLQTLARIAEGLGESIGTMLGEGPAMARRQPPSVDPRAVHRVVKTFRAALAAVEQLAAALPEDEP